jgi:hypothetical protein
VESPRGQFGPLLRPVVERRRIEVRPVRPHERAGLRVQRYRLKRCQILQWPEQHAAQDRLEIDPLFGPVVNRTINV